MAARASWKGFLKLSLVSVPVKAFTSTATSSEIRLNQLHGECHNRIRYRKVCPEHGEVGNDEIVSGYEYGKDQYVIIEEEELDKLRTENDKSITIDGFVDDKKQDTVYQNGRTYYYALVAYDYGISHIGDGISPTENHIVIELD